MRPFGPRARPGQMLNTTTTISTIQNGSLYEGRSLLSENENELFKTYRILYEQMLHRILKLSVAAPNLTMEEHSSNMMLARVTQQCNDRKMWIDAIQGQKADKRRAIVPRIPSHPLPIRRSAGRPREAELTFIE
ncbi:hypothetical protein EVAR_7636_1 [Eumeta japonica]|uniref:Uncharacterized protein n=1 Tax=Eumeta variegata TaxID=151549 RepID=A0A4C1TLE6_EUMVA|nr:hypothetical protein EVAR_7636_1 [Eumeta japonica]